MNNKLKQLLLVDLCARLPYGVICSIYRTDDVGVGWRDEKLVGYFENSHSYEFNFGKDCISVDNVDKIKPYLRPMSSMTEEEKKEYDKLFSIRSQGETYCENWEWIDFMNSHHFDYRVLIEKGLAIAVTEENNPYGKNSNS